jgi:hypothetical protein
MKALFPTKTAAVFLKKCEQIKCQLTSEWRNLGRYDHTVGYHSVTKKNKWPLQCSFLLLHAHQEHDSRKQCVGKFSVTGFAYNHISPAMTLQLPWNVCFKHFTSFSRCTLNSWFREMESRPHLDNWNVCLLSTHHPVAFSPHSICTNFYWGHFCCKMTTLKWQQDSTWVKKNDIQNVELSPPSRAGGRHVSIS